MRPVKATGWKLMPETQSTFSMATANDVAELVVVHALDDGGHKDDFHAGGAAVLDDLHLGLQQRLPARAAIDVIVDAVELQVKRRQAGRLRLAARIPDRPARCRWWPLECG